MIKEKRFLPRIPKTLTFILITLLILILIFIFAKIDIWSVIRALETSTTMYLFCSIIPQAVSILILVKRWQTILYAMRYQVSFSRCFKIVMAALPLTSITPSKSGDVIRAYYLRDEIPLTKTAGSVLTERIFDVLTLILFSLAGMALYHRYEFAGAVLVMLVLTALLLFLLCSDLQLPVREPWNSKAQNFALSMKLLIRNKKALISVTLYSLLIWLLSIIQTLLFFYALGIEIPMAFVMGNIPIAIFIGMIPVTLGGMGTRDAAIIVLFSEYASPSELLAVGILFSAFRYWLLSLIGIPFMRMMTKIPRS